MIIKRFFDRNKPIFLIGTLMGIVFIGIIIFYKIKPKEETRLSEMGEADQEFYQVIYENIDEPNYNYPNPQDGSTEEPINSRIGNGLSEQTIDEKYGTLEIEFTEEGFEPRVTRAVLGQEISWKNSAERTIYLHQRTKKYSELKDLIEIAPGETFNFRMTQLGIWAYDENESEKFGSIDVRDPIKLPPVENSEIETAESATNP
jgi:hypothetical protein